jgi:hypothetical protein
VPFLFDDTAVVRPTSLIANQTRPRDDAIRFTDVQRFADGRWHAGALEETAPQQH